MSNFIDGYDEYDDDDYEHEPETLAETDRESLELELLMVEAIVNQLKSIVADQDNPDPSAVEMQFVKAQTLQLLAQTALTLTDATTVLIPRHRLRKLLDTAKLENSLKRGYDERNSNT